MCNNRCPLDDGYDGGGYWPGLSAILSSATGNTPEMQWSEISFLVYQQSSNEVRTKKSWNYIFFNLVFIKRYNVFLNNHILWKCSDECMAFNTCKNYYIYYITFVYQSYSFTRCTMNLHCSCEWLHALENVYLESERLAKVRKSNIFEQCTDTLKEDCGEFIWHLIQFCMWYCTSNVNLKKRCADSYSSSAYYPFNKTRLISFLFKKEKRKNNFDSVSLWKNLLFSGM